MGHIGVIVGPIAAVVGIAITAVIVVIVTFAVISTCKVILL